MVVNSMDISLIFLELLGLSLESSTLTATINESTTIRRRHLDVRVTRMTTSVVDSMPAWPAVDLDSIHGLGMLYLYENKNLALNIRDYIYLDTSVFRMIP